MNSVDILRCRRRPAAGFGLVELLYVVALLGLLLGLAVPGSAALLREAAMTRAVNALVADVHRARQAAQSTARPFVLCSSADGRHCDDSLDWSAGWLLAPAQRFAAPAETAIGREAFAASTGILIRANRRAFEFRPFTLRDTNGSVWFCDRRARARGRRLVISPTGRPRLTFSEETAG